MKMRKILSGSILFLFSLPASAGVEMNMVTEVPAGGIVESVTVMAQDGKIRIEEIGDTTGAAMSMVFLGQEFIVIDHSNKSYILMDEAKMAEMGSKVNAAMAQMEKRLAGMPAEQRAMYEQMLEQRMGGNEQKPAQRIVEAGSGSWDSGDCTKYEVYEGEVKTQELCAADLADVDGADEAMAAFESMARFMGKISESMPDGLGASMAENPMVLMEKIDGFPVHTIDYANGTIASETTLKSVDEKSLDPSLFGIPEGYIPQDPFAGR